jgi:serine/threonine-protein kinase
MYLSATPMARQNRAAVIGTLISGRFRLEEQIGAGGMATVYRAFDETLERWVAIKVLLPEVAGEADQLERFRREARAAARLSDPNVVAVIDAGEDDGRPYIVFQYIEGETLKDRIRRQGRLPVGEAVAYAIEIGRALAAAHAERLVHRDVKPQNVLIDHDGRAKVTDFGIARSLEMDGLTQPGRVLGTTDYVSPEQALGRKVTPQSDLYSLGICLFEMLSGRVPYRADTQVGVAMKHVREPMPDVRARRPEISASLAAVVERATAKETQNRYATAEELVSALEQALAIEAARSGEAPGEATNVLRRLPSDTADFVPLRVRNRSRYVAAALLALAAAAVVAVLVVGRTEQGTRGGAAPQGSGGLEPITVPTGAATDYDPAGDGRESPTDARNALDGERQTQWDTERYRADLAELKPGVGLYIDAGRPVVTRRLDAFSELPGWEAEVYAAATVPQGIEGWQRVSGRQRFGHQTQVQLDTAGRPFRYYLVWIVALPPDRKAAINELTLLR